MEHEEFEVVSVSKEISLGTASGWEEEGEEFIVLEEEEQEEELEWEMEMEKERESRKEIERESRASRRERKRTEMELRGRTFTMEEVGFLFHFIFVLFPFLFPLSTFLTLFHSYHWNATTHLPSWSVPPLLLFLPPKPPVLSSPPIVKYLSLFLPLPLLLEEDETPSSKDLEGEELTPFLLLVQILPLPYPPKIILHIILPPLKLTPPSLPRGILHLPPRPHQCQNQSQSPLCLVLNLVLLPPVLLLPLSSLSSLLVKNSRRVRLRTGREGNQRILLLLLLRVTLFFHRIFH